MPVLVDVALDEIGRTHRIQFGVSISFYSDCPCNFFFEVPVSIDGVSVLTQLAKLYGSKQVVIVPFYSDCPGSFRKSPAI